MNSRFKIDFTPGIGMPREVCPQSQKEEEKREVCPNSFGGLCKKKKKTPLEAKRSDALIPGALMVVYSQKVLPWSYTVRIQVFSESQQHPASFFFFDISSIQQV